MENNSEQNNNTELNYSYSQQEQKLIQEINQVRLEQGKQELEYINLDDFEMPPATQFSMLKKPAVSIKFNQFTFNMACVRLFSDIRYVQTIIHREKKYMVVVPCANEEFTSVQWSRLKNEETIVNKSITSVDFLDKIYKLMNWDQNIRYKVLGRVVNSNRGLVILFDLTEAIMFTEPEEYTDKETGETKKRQPKFYPDKYKNCIGMSYSDYLEAHQRNLFVDFDEIQQEQNTNNEVNYE